MDGAKHKSSGCRECELERGRPQVERLRQSLRLHERVECRERHLPWKLIIFSLIIRGSFLFNKFFPAGKHSSYFKKLFRKF